MYGGYTPLRSTLYARLNPFFEPPPEQLVAAARALEVSRGNDFQRVDLERRIRK
jgi:hypothetical protein